MTRTRTFAIGATAAALTLALSACSDDSTPDPTSSSSTSGSSEPTNSQSSTVTPKDRSKQVFDAYTAREKVLGSTTGKIPSNNTSAPTDEVTFEVLGVEATSDATILRYQLTAEQRTTLGIDGADWSHQPTLRIPGSNTRAQTLTAALPEYRDQRANICLCTALTFVLTTPQPQEVVYPALPEDVTKIDVILDELDPVTVPVTR